MDSKRYIPAILILPYLLFLILQAMPVLAGSPRFWGMDQWYYYSKTTVLVFLVIGLIPVFQFSHGAFSYMASRISSVQVIRRIDSHAAVKYALFLSGATVLFWVFRQSTHFLGDGYLWADRMQTGTLFSYARPLSSSLYEVAFVLIKISGLPIAASSYTAAVVVSILSGLVFLIFADKTVRALSDQSHERIFLFLAILSSGTLTLFFGYVEAYAPVAAGLMAFIYFGVRYVQHRESAHFVTIIFLLNISLHLTLIALLPSLIVIFLIRGETTPARRKLYLMFSAVIVLGLAVLWIARTQRLFSGFFYNNFLPLISAPQNSLAAYPMISAKHGFDSLNEILLICPIAILSVAGLVHSAKEHSNRNGKISLFLKSITIFYVLEYLIFNKVLGAARDWDIFSPLGIALALYIAVSLLERFRNVPHVLAVFSFFLLVLHNGPWIVVNSSKEKSLNRFICLVSNGYWSNYARAYGYELLGKHSLNNNDVPRTLKYLNAALEADPKNKRYKYELARIFMDSKQYPQALKYYLGREQNTARTLNELGMVYSMSGHHALAEEMYEEAIKADSKFLRAYENLAALYMQTGRMEQAIATLEKCIEVAPDVPKLYRNLGLLYEKIDNRDKAKHCFEKAIELEERENK